MPAPPCCLHCRYELTGFAVGDTCPECGTTIRTLAPDENIATAATVSLIAGGAGMLCLLFAGLSFAVGSFTLGSLGLFWFVASAIGFVYAVWALIAIRRDPRHSSRRTALAAWIGCCLNAPAVILIIVVAAAFVLR